MRIKKSINRFLITSKTSFFLPFFIFKFVFGSVGNEYDISKLTKFKIVIKFIRNKLKIKSLTTLIEHFLLAEEIFNIPKSLEGDVVECGCYNGGSTSVLSLACALTNRRLFVCDSFEGLPEDEKYSRFFLFGKKSLRSWKKGQFGVKGGINKVKENIKRYGDIRVCNFVEGYFKDTLKDIETESIVLIFEDADLLSSVKDCLKFLWPKLLRGCKYYCHEPWAGEIKSLFYDNKWWNKELNSDAPGFSNDKSGMRYGILKLKSIDFTEK